MHQTYDTETVVATLLCMPVPDFQTVMLPLLRDLESGERQSLETVNALALHFELSPIQTTIVLVDGAQLADYMIDHNVGVTTAKRFEVKRVDSDYFAVE